MNEEDFSAFFSCEFGLHLVAIGDRSLMGGLGIILQLGYLVWIHVGGNPGGTRAFAK